MMGALHDNFELQRFSIPEGLLLLTQSLTNQPFSATFCRRFLRLRLLYQARGEILL
jgi:hypothetical protein